MYDQMTAQKQAHWTSSGMDRECITEQSARVQERKCGCIESQLESLLRAAGEVDSAVSQLYGRIEPALSPSPPACTKEGCNEAAPPAAPLANAIAVIAQQLRRVRERLDDMASRCEL